MNNPLIVKMADRFGVNQSDVVTTLKATCFKGPVNDSQMIALLIVADQYGLNPWTKEIYAFPDKNNGIVPVVGLDGWSRIINENQQFDGMDFSDDDLSCTCTIYRKDRSHPIRVTEYLAECRRTAGPWQSHPKRMLRHKAMIQCARLAFGFVGIFDQDEAERIGEAKDITPKRQNAAVIAQQMNEIPSSPERDSLIADLECIVLEQGQDAYALTFKQMTNEQRQLLGAEEHKRIWAMGGSND